MKAIINATLVALLVWAVITVLSVASYVYVGLQCADGLRCLAVTP